MFAQTLATEMHSLAAIVPVIADQGVGIWTFQGKASLPQGLLRGAEVRRTRVVGSVITRLRHKPMGFPADFAA